MSLSSNLSLQLRFLCFTLALVSTCVASEISIGPYDKDIKYTIWATNKESKKRFGDPLKQNIPLSKGKTAKEDCGAKYNCSLSTADPGPQQLLGRANSFDLVGTFAPNQTAPLDEVLISLAGFTEIVFPSIFDAGAVDNLVGFIDVREYFLGHGQFTFDPQNPATFTFVNGKSAALPGFTVAVTPDLNAFFDDVFTYVEGLGPQLNPGANAVLFTGTAIAEGQADGGAIPEPSTFLLIAGGMSWIGLRIRCARGGQTA